MHILKKIKKRFGLVRRNFTCLGPTNLPPLQFHNVHGDNIRISRDGTLARRFESFCRAITFSARPVRINERICIKFSEISNNWNGGIRFGFTSHDPATLSNALPKYVCPDLTNRPGFWAKALHEQYCEKNNILTYYVNSVGDVIFCINNEEKGVILSGIDTRGLLWAVFDVYGNCTSIEFVNYNNYSLVRSNNVFHSNENAIMEGGTNGSVLSSMQSLKISNNIQIEHKQKVNDVLIPISFHKTKGRNIILSNDQFIATRKSNDFCQGYVFTSRPVSIGEKITVQILETEYLYCGTLALGLTSCNPLELNSLDLPDDSEYLLDRPEYWVISKDIATKSQRGDEITFSIGQNGEVSIKINNDPAFIVMHVDQNLKLWAFFDVYGSTKSIRIFKCESTLSGHNNEDHVLEPLSEFQKVPNSEAETKNAEYQETQIFPGGQSLAGAKACKSKIQQQPALKMNSIQKSRQSLNIQSSSNIVCMPSPSSVFLVNLPTSSKSSTKINEQNQTSVDCFSRPNIQEGGQDLQGTVVLDRNKWKEEKSYPSDLLECTICYENTIDSVLYTCGHMCMCFDCAVKQWRGSGGGQCPLCRATIRDVIRTYVT